MARRRRPSGALDSEIEAVRDSLDWAEPGDLLVLLLHRHRKGALDLLQDLKGHDWRPGARLPAGE